MNILWFLSRRSTDRGRAASHFSQRPRQRASDIVIDEIIQLRRRGFRFIALADDNFYPVSLTDIKLAEQQNNQQKLTELRTVRNERFELMTRLAELPEDMVFFTQITMEAAEDTQFLDAMCHARIMGVLVGVEAVTPEGLKALHGDGRRSDDVLQGSKQIVENIRTVNAICNGVLEFAQSKSLKLVELASDLADRPQALLRG